MTADTGEFLAEAGEFLRAEPARNSVMLTVTADVLAAGPEAGDGGMLFGWWRPEAGCRLPRSCTRRVSPSCCPA